MDGVVHFDLPADDVKRSQKFYSDTFGWEIAEVPGMQYTVVRTTSVGRDGMLVEKGKINGARVVINPNKTPVGLYVNTRDPEGMQ
jgi:predicted enzyme related to lactoylglutathione lyase